VTIDTLRADHLGAYGYARPTSPAIDALARTSTVFENAVPTCPATAPSVASILTGAHRATHRVFGNGWTLPDGAETLAEILKARGFHTVGRVANLSVDATAGFAQGFDDFAVPAALERAGPGMLEGGPLVADALGLVDALGDTPTFLWLHFMDPHGPYFPPEAVRAEFRPDDYRWPDERDLPIGTSNFGLGIVPAYQVVNGETAPARYRARYDAEIRYVDQHVGALVDRLRARGLWERVLFVLTADHGESLGEHGYYFAHGWFAYDDVLRVPLVLHGPGVPEGRRVPASVSLVDLAPTVLDLAGVPAGEGMEGVSLRPLLDGNGGDREAFAQTYYGEGLVALRQGRTKYIFKPARGQTGARSASDPPLPDRAEEWLFDLDADPAESHSVAAAKPDVVARMRARLQAWLADQERRGHGRAAEQPRKDGTGVRVLGDPQLERQLRALGYVD
jgi:arylsulfatase